MQCRCGGQTLIGVCGGARTHEYDHWGVGAPNQGSIYVRCVRNERCNNKESAVIICVQVLMYRYSMDIVQMYCTHHGVPYGIRTGELGE
jgi:hypothetical protein